jgi:L-arabinonolactonase
MLDMHEQVAELRIDCRNALGEMPVWSRQSATLYWIDVIKPGRVFYWETATNRVDFWEFADLVTGIDLCSGGGLLVRDTTEVFRFDPATGRSHHIFSLPESQTRMRFNDGHCDRNGRLWVGTMENNITEDGKPLAITQFIGQVFAVTDKAATSVDMQLGCPNAICWSPDGATLYVADSCNGWIYACSFDCPRGTISNRRPFCQLSGLGIPDGAAVDCDGYIWNARWGAGVVARISPDGRLDRVVRIPASQPTACCFGGDALRTLYVTTARFAMPDHALRAEPYAGGVFEIPVDVPGLEQPAFADQYETESDQ